MNKIIYYFIFLCIFIRILISFLVKNLNKKYYYIVSIITFIISISFIKNYFFYKKNDIGFFKGKVWWNNYKLIHAFNYLLVSFLSYKKNDYTWYILLIDALFGSYFFYLKYFTLLL